ncbi:putative glutamate receptor ionotropic NMDA 2A-like [Scophthalmus maximus]|uniref:Putative glutamate receptor ionotropic NMDA 2A-like n=1 Tax=Scophthalmus maximus TaxID=52904 RepID=A0A2U9BMH0_SCOMX|nr:putative glutamate receptor ionotropic NMDA 2A-like [Scophthalmus maximus]
MSHGERKEDARPIKFEHFCSGFVDAVRRNRNASERTGHGGCAHGRSRRGSTAQHSPAHGLRRRRRKTPATANPPQPRFVTPKEIGRPMMPSQSWLVFAQVARCSRELRERTYK